MYLSAARPCRTPESEPELHSELELALVRNGGACVVPVLRLDVQPTENRRRAAVSVRMVCARLGNSGSRFDFENDHMPLFRFSLTTLVLLEQGFADLPELGRRVRSSSPLSRAGPSEDRGTGAGGSGSCTLRSQAALAAPACGREFMLCPRSSGGGVRLECECL